MQINAWAAKGPKQPLEPFAYDPGPLRQTMSRSPSSTAGFVIPTHRSSTMSGESLATPSFPDTR